MKKIIMLFSTLFTVALVLTISFVTTKASSNIINIASPDLTDKEYLSDGVYTLYNANGIAIDYNVYNGEYTINGTQTLGSLSIDIGTIITTNGQSYSSVYYYLFGTGIITTNWILPNESLNVGVSTEDNIVTVFSSGQTMFRFWLSTEGRVFDNFTFKVQIEKGSTATAYQTPIGALKQHSQFQYNDGYTDGVSDGYADGVSDGYADGFDDGLQASTQSSSFLDFSNLENITFLGRSQAGPNDRYFGFEIDNIDTYINNVSFFTTMPLAHYNYLAPVETFSSGLRAGITLFTDNGNKHYDFADMGFNATDSEYTFSNQFPSNKVNRIEIRFLLIDGSIPEFTQFQQYLFDNISLYANHQYYNDLYITRIKDIYYDRGYDFATLDYQTIVADLQSQVHNITLDYERTINDLQSQVDGAYDLGYDFGYNYGKDIGHADGYEKGINDNVTTGGFLLILSSAFAGVSTLLSIELLPNITIGMIVAVPLVFGILFFILGKRKD